MTTKQICWLCSWALVLAVRFRISHEIISASISIDETDLMQCSVVFMISDIMMYCLLCYSYHLNSHWIYWYYSLQEHDRYKKSLQSVYELERPILMLIQRIKQRNNKVNCIIYVRSLLYAKITRQNSSAFLFLTGYLWLMMTTMRASIHSGTMRRRRKRISPPPAILWPSHPPPPPGRLLHPNPLVPPAYHPPGLRAHQTSTTPPTKWRLLF